ncbi:MAG: HU family DNA-binding protein [Alloprevotella sp.]|nr:HU family DNA-binding protein [Alloprevotella sp.]
MIKYKTYASKNPKTKLVKYYACPVEQRPVNRDQFFEQIEAESTVTEHDVKAVLSAMQRHLWNNLREGRSVRLGDLGSFHITLNSTGAEQPEDFTVKNIKKVRVRFRPSAKFLYNLSTANPNVTFSLQKEKDAADGEEESGNEG